MSAELREALRVTPRPLVRRFLSGLITIAAAIAIVGGLSFLFIPKNNQKEFGMIDERENGVIGEPQDTIDVLFVGDSEAYTAISPLQIWHEQGFTAYDAASPGQKLPYANTLLRRAFKRQSPHVVVFETNSLYREFSFSDGLMRTLQDVLPVLEYHARWKTLTLADLTRMPQATWRHSFRGYVPKKEAKEADTSSYGRATDEVAEVPRNNRMWLAMMVRFCRKNGATPILISVPSPVNWNQKRHNGIQELADKLGVRYVDLNLVHEKIGLDWATDSFDRGDHLNSSGATKVSSYVGKYLSAAFDLKDHRGDAAYASWDASYERYRAILAE